MNTKEEILQKHLDKNRKGNTTQIQFCYTAIFDAMREYHEQIEAAKNISLNPDVSGSQNLCGWVDVKDRLPSHNKEVLIIDANYNDYYGIGSYRKNDGWAVSGANYWLPTHWKELDKPSVGG